MPIGGKNGENCQVVKIHYGQIDNIFHVTGKISSEQERKVEKFTTKFGDDISESLHDSRNFSLKSSLNWVIHILG